MSDPLVFPDASPRFALPLLAVAQAQKEAFVNEAHSRADALLHCAIEATTDDPPATPAEGESWLVGAAPTGAWSGQAGNLACRQSGQWLFVAPRDGMRLFNRDAGRDMRFVGSWRTAERPADPTAGAIIDSEARAAILELIAAMESAGIVSPA